MTQKVKVQSFAVSLDGFSAGANQSLENPLGERGPELMDWFFPTKVFRSMHGSAHDGETGADNRMAEKGFENIGAWILGRNMFGPIRGPWLNGDWKGWWGDEPPYHVPTFVLTHHAREPLVMKGGTTFYFVTDGPESALAQARAAAGDKDIRIGGGTETIRQYLKLRAIDEMHLAVRPLLLGEGENLMQGLDLRALGYECSESIVGERATHMIIRKQG